ncbi:MAG: hypothetical protein Q7R94_00560, partial [bacterium]|nr:hypothetical protein [bacterium]
KMKTKITIATLLTMLIPFSAKAQVWDTGQGMPWDPGKLAMTNLPSAPIYIIISRGLSWMLAIFSLLAVIGFVISGIMYLTSIGDDTRMKTAKNMMIYSITGVVVGLAGVVVIFTIDRLLRGTLF